MFDRLDLDRHVAVTAVVNRTRDPFFDAGHTSGSHRPSMRRPAGSLATAVWVHRARRPLRVHDVAHVVARMMEALLGWPDPAYLRHTM